MPEPAQATQAPADAGAWAGVIARWEPRIKKIARSYRLDAAAAEDVAQETWAEFHLHWREVEHPGAWLSAVARHKSADRIRRSRLIPVSGLALLEEAPDPCAPHDDITAGRLDDIQLGGRAADAVRALARQQRRALLLYAEHGSYALGAAELGTSVGAFKSHLHRARVNIRARLGMPVPPRPPGLLGAGEVAALARVNRRRVSEWTLNGVLPAAHVHGRANLYRREEVERLARYRASRLIPSINGVPPGALVDYRRTRLASDR